MNNEHRWGIIFFYKCFYKTFSTFKTRSLNGQLKTMFLGRNTYSTTNLTPHQNISFLVNTRVVKNAVSVKISIYCKRSIKILSRAARASTSHVLVEKFNIWIKRTFLLFFGRSHVTNRTTYKLMFSRNLKIGKYIVENTFKSRAVLLCNTTADE